MKSFFKPTIFATSNKEILFSTRMSKHQNVRTDRNAMVVLEKIDQNASTYACALQKCATFFIH